LAWTSALKGGTKPPLKSAAVHRPSSLAPFGDRAPVALNRPIASSRALVSGFKEKVSMNFIVLFPMSLHGPGLPEPCAQVRASSHVGCILGATSQREPREGTQRGLFLERGAATRSQTWRS